MDLLQLLAQLREHNIQLHLGGENNDQLKVKAPKGAMTPQFRDMIRANKAELIALIQTATQATGTSQTKVEITPRPSGAERQPSIGQQRIWEHYNIDRESPLYNIPYIFEIEGGLDQELLRLSLEQTIHFHPIMRSYYPVRAGEPTVNVFDPEPVEIRYSELESSDPATIKRHISESSYAPFDLELHPLYRFYLFQTAPQHYTFLAVIHHIIFDGWSADLFWGEVKKRYAALLNKTPFVPPTTEVDYFDYAVWHRNWMESDAKEQELAFWKKELSGEIEPTHIPGRKPAEELTHASVNMGGLASFDLSSELSERVKQGAKAMSVTPFILFKTLYALTLNRYTNQKDLLICTPLAGRVNSATEKMIGYFNNIIVLRAGIDATETCKALLTRARKSILNAFNYQTLPFQELYSLPNLRRVPLARAFFALEDALSYEVFALQGTQVNRLALEEYSADFDWSLFINEKENRFYGQLWYKQETYSAAVVEQFVANFLTVVEAVLANPDQLVATLPTFIDPLAGNQPAAHDDLIGAPELTPYVAPRNEIEEKLAAIWEALFDHSPIGIHDNFFEIGGHSTMAVQLFSKIFKTFELNLSLATLITDPTIEALGKTIAAQKGLNGDPAQENENQPAWSPLVAIQKGDGIAPFFCIHGAGGNVLNFYGLAKLLGPNQTFYGLQAQGVDGILMPLETVEEMVDLYLDVLRSVQPSGPYRLGGYSFGGLLAYEMARQLTAAGEVVDKLIMLDTFRPELESRKLTFRDRLSWMKDRGAVNFLADKSSEYLAIYDRLRKREIDGEKNVFVSHEDRETFLYHTIAGVVKKFKPQPYGGDIHMLRGKVIWQIHDHLPDDYNWGELVPKVHIRWVDGDHLTILDEENIAQVATAVHEILNPVDEKVR